MIAWQLKLFAKKAPKKTMLFAGLTFVPLDEHVSKELGKQIETHGGIFVYAIPQTTKVKIM